jgi:hypothetical protein
MNDFTVKLGHMHGVVVSRILNRYIISVHFTFNHNIRTPSNLKKKRNNLWGRIDQLNQPCWQSVSFLRSYVSYMEGLLKSKYLNFLLFSEKLVMLLH